MISQFLMETFLYRNAEKLYRWIFWCFQSFSARVVLVGTSIWLFSVPLFFWEYTKSLFTFVEYTVKKKTKQTSRCIIRACLVDSERVDDKNRVSRHLEHK